MAQRKVAMLKSMVTSMLPLQTWQILRLFALAALENKLVYGADVSNAFAEADAPAQVYYMRVDKSALADLKISSLVDPNLIYRTKFC